MRIYPIYTLCTTAFTLLLNLLRVRALINERGWVGADLAYYPPVDAIVSQAPSFKQACVCLVFTSFPPECSFDLQLEYKLNVWMSFSRVQIKACRTG